MMLLNTAPTLQMSTYELPKMKCFFKGFFLVICWELSRLRPTKMGAYLTTTLNTDTIAVKCCTNTAKWHILQPTEYFLAFLEFS